MLSPADHKSQCSVDVDIDKNVDYMISSIKFVASFLLFIEYHVVNIFVCF